MSVWSKIVTALRGSANEVGEAIADTQALRILDQEIRDAEEELKNSRDSLAEMMARQKVAEQKCAELNAKITEFEDYAIKALEKNDESLALDLSEKIADLVKQLNTEQNACNNFTRDSDELRIAIKQADQNIKQLKHDVHTVKATENVQRTQAASSQQHSDSNSRLSTAMSSLERIKEKQALKNARFIAEQELAEDLSEDSLNNRLEAAGIVSESESGDAVLGRLKNKMTMQIESDNHSTEGAGKK